MVIPENLKTLGLGILIGGGSLFAFKSCQQSNDLAKALLEIDSAKQLIVCTIDTIKSAQKSILLTRDTLQHLSKLAEQTRVDIDGLRRERTALVNDFKANLRAQSENVAKLSGTVQQFDKLRKQLENDVKAANSPDVIKEHQ